MSPPDLNRLVGVLRTADPDVMDADELCALTANIAQLKSWCDSLQVRATRRQLALAAEGRADDPQNTIAREGRQSSKAARAAAEREHVCTSMPVFEEALLTGSNAAGHVDAVANATRNLADDIAAEFAGCSGDLLSDALRLNVDAFEQSCRELAKRLTAAAATASDADDWTDSGRLRVYVGGSIVRPGCATPTWSSTRFATGHTGPRSMRPAPHSSRAMAIAERRGISSPSMHSSVRWVVAIAPLGYRRSSL